MIGLGNSVDRKEARVRRGGGGEAVTEKNFSAVGQQFGPKIRGAVPLPGPSPIAATELLKQAAKHKKSSPFKP